LPNVGPYIYDVSISGFTRSSIYIYDISSLRVNNTSSDCNSVILCSNRDTIQVQSLINAFSAGGGTPLQTPWVCRNITHRLSSQQLHIALRVRGKTRLNADKSSLPVVYCVYINL